MKRLNKFLICLLAMTFLSGCVYYNTFYYARKSFNEAEAKRKTIDRKGLGASAGLYKRAIEKSDKVIEKYHNSKWYDDALFINGVSQFYTENYSRAEKRFRELLADFPNFNNIKETRIYLAKTKLMLGDEAEAMTIFEKMFSESGEKSVKSDAAMALGEYYYENKNYEASQTFFNSIIDSLGNESDRLISQMYIADGYFSRFRYKDALQNYQKLLELNPGSAEKYRATFRAGECNYFLNKIDKGMEYYKQLADDPAYFDSLGQVRLQIALGHELNGDLFQAEEIYQLVAIESADKPAGATANYNLGLIYQFDYEDYKKAKSYYDKAKGRGADKIIAQDALQRSSDIGKLEMFKEKNLLDTSSTREEIDSAAATQYLLAELYFFQLNKPDSAFQEFKYITDNFSDSYFAPKALIAMATLKRDYYDDTLGFDSTLRIVLRDYPRSDFVPEAINLLGLAGTLADTGYASYYYHKAENFAFEKGNADSAKYYFNFVADSFPTSQLYQKAKFASIWINEEFFSPGDSSLYYAYAEFVDSFPKSEYGKEADRKLLIHEGKAVKPVDKVFDEQPAVQYAEAAVADSTTQETLQDSILILPEDKNFIDPDGNRIGETKGDPIRVEKEFRYPPSAYITNFEGILYFQIKIDAFGKVADFRLMNPTESPELNKEAEEVIALTLFDTDWMAPNEYNTWFVYKYRVDRPAGMQ